MWGLVPQDKAGTTVIRVSTPVGSVQVTFEQLPSSIEVGAEPYPVEHLIKQDEDFETTEWILDRAEFVPMYELFDEENLIGDAGYVVPLIHRLPFSADSSGVSGRAGFYFCLPR